MSLKGWGVSRIEEALKVYREHFKTTRQPSSFIMPVQDYLELCGISPEDAHCFGEEILDIINNEWSPI